MIRRIISYRAAIFHQQRAVPAAELRILFSDTLNLSPMVKFAFDNTQFPGGESPQPNVGYASAVI